MPNVDGWECSIPGKWSIHTVVGHSLGPGSDVGKAFSRLDYFLLMLPPDQPATMVTLTSENLLSKTKAATTPGDLNLNIVVTDSHDRKVFDATICFYISKKK